MTEQHRQGIEKIIQEGYLHSSTLCLQDGLRIYRSRFRDFAVFSLFLPLASLVFSLLGLGMTGTLLFSLFILPVLNAGYYLVADRIVGKQEVEFRHFLAGRHHAWVLIANTLLAALISALILLPIYFLYERIGMWEFYQELQANPVDPPEPPMMNSAQSTTFFLNLIPLVYLQVGFSWAFPLILFYQAGPWQALELSRRLINKRWGAQFMLLLTFFSLLLIGAFVVTMLLSINAGLANIAAFGLFLITPWAYCSLYAGFTRITLPLRVEEPEE